MNAATMTSSLRPGTTSLVQAGRAPAQAPSSPSVESELTKHVQAFVASSFFGTMLKQMRESPFRSELFGGGRAGEAYDAMYHQALAERMGRGVGQGLVRAIVKRIMGARASEGLQAPRSSGTQLNLAA